MTNKVKKESQQQLTPLRVVGSPPPGMELFHLNDSNDEITSNTSMARTYHENDTPARRQHADDVLKNLQGDSYKKDRHIRKMKDAMVGMI